MSFCRLGADSDVYCYYHADGFYDVWAQGEECQFQTAQEVINFLEKLKAHGEKVPNYAFEQLKEATP
jgi:hypothetical protein